MFLRNYTSSVPASVTIARIEKVLIECKVSGITKEYDGLGKVSALRFEIPDAAGLVTIRLPAYEDRALDALWLDYAAGETLSKDGLQIVKWNSKKRKKRSDFRDQAERTSWRLVQDWVEIQMSMIQLKQAETLEVFLPYVWDGKQTLYQLAKVRGIRALLPAHNGGL